jgi:GDPmannose 4,6-dehydratase
MSKTKTVLITGISGQDGSYLADLLLEKRCRVFGTTHPGSRRLAAGAQKRRSIERVEWDGLDQKEMERILAYACPDECYNLAAYASGTGMYDDPLAIAEVNGLAVVRILEAIRSTSPRTRLVQASSSEVFGHPQASPQDESAARNPRSPYGAAKLYADSMVKIYRERYGLFACSALLYNHESPLRSSGFVSSKITRAAAAISMGLAEYLSLGDLDARRDWGYAGDYVRAMWMMLQVPKADDYVVATGASHSVRQMCDYAFGRVGLDYREYVREDPSAFRPPEPVPLLGDASKARRNLGWMPTVDFKMMIEMMVDNDIARLRESDDPIGANDESL